jgi:hypothetical protein
MEAYRPCRVHCRLQERLKETEGKRVVQVQCASNAQLAGLALTRPAPAPCTDLLTNEKPDERQIMTYVSCYYHAFQGAMQVARS